MIAVTGANGLVGSSVIRKLIEAGEPCVAIKRENSDTSLLQDVADKVIWRNADILDAVSLDEALRDVSSVVHAAALVSYDPRDKKKIFEINATGTRNIVNASLHRQVKRFVHISSVAALGRPKEAKYINEEQKWIDNPLHSVYAQSKYAAELEVQRAHEEGLNAVIVNPSVILGPGDWSKTSARIFEYAWKEKPFYTTGTINYVSLQDVTTIIHRLLFSEHRGERFIVNAGAVTYKSLLDLIAKHFRKKPPSVGLSPKTIYLLAWAETIRSRITGARPLITSETARIAGSTVFYSNEKVKSKLKFEFQPIEATLHWCCDYYLRQVNGIK